MQPRASCLRLLVHWARRAASRAACTAGSSSAINTAMMAMTTSNSISVNPGRIRGLRDLDMALSGNEGSDRDPATANRGGRGLHAHDKSRWRENPSPARRQIHADGEDSTVARAPDGV